MEQHNVGGTDGNILIQNALQTVTMGMTQKKGTGAGNYTTTSATFVDIDTTNLSFATVVPTGWKALITFSATATMNVSANANFAITDAGTGLIIAGITGTTNQIISFQWVFAGDGASHTFKPQYSIAGGNTLTAFNSAANLTPVMTVLLLPSN